MTEITRCFFYNSPHSKKVYHICTGRCLLALSSDKVCRTAITYSVFIRGRFTHPLHLTLNSL
jgi:hypothetical protein